jgi:hypothetical protein
VGGRGRNSKVYCLGFVANHHAQMFCLFKFIFGSNKITN